MRQQIYILISVCIFLGNASAWGEKHQFALLGDAGENNNHIERVFKSLEQTEVRRLVLLGDQLYKLKKTYAQVWDRWKLAGFQFEVVTLGNHHTTYAEEMAYFEMPAEFYAKAISPQIKFLVLNSDNEQTVDEQMKWFENELASATEKFVFVVYHHPSLTMHRTHKWKEKEQFQIRARELLERYRSKVTALLVGHDHIATMMEYGDLPVILSGATQDIRFGFPPEGRQEGIEITNHWYFDFHSYWVRLTIDDETDAAQVEFVRAKDSQVMYSTELVTGQRLTTPPCTHYLTKIRRFFLFKKGP